MSAFSVLFVSTGNVCRSPMAERLAERGLRRALGPAATAFRCFSAGTWGHDGAPMEPNAAAVLFALGARETGFVARELLPEQIGVADLVLTASAEQRLQVELTDAGSGERAFTMREFAALARAFDPDPTPAAPVARARALVAGAVRARRTGQPGSVARELDIADPYGAPLNSFRLCAAEILDCLTPFLSVVAAAEAPSNGRLVR